TPLPAEQCSVATAGSDNRQPSHRRCFNRQGNALQLSHRNWIKPRLASGRSPDSRIFEFEIPSRAIRKKPSPCGRQPSGVTFSISPRLQLRGSAGFSPASRSPDDQILYVKLACKSSQRLRKSNPDHLLRSFRRITLIAPC